LDGDVEITGLGKEYERKREGERVTQDIKERKKGDKG
jgi:hypothetical protein